MRTNRIADPVTTATTTWSAVGGTTSIVSGKYRLSPAGTTTAYLYPNAPSGYGTSGRHTIAPSDNIAARVEVSNPTATPNYVRLNLAYYTSSGAAAGTTVTGPMTIIPAGGTVTLEAISTVPASASTVAGVLPIVYTYSTAAGAIATTSNTTDITRFLLEIGATAPTVSPLAFFYGGDSSTYTAWAGTANATPSFYYQTAPTTVALTDAGPGPRVQVNFAEFLPATATATIHRLTESDVVVPGADRAAALGGLIRTDYYAPFQVPVRYIAEMFDVNGLSLGFTEGGTAYLDVSEAWITSPIDPKLSMSVDMAQDAGSSLRDSVSATMHEINGRRILIAEADYGLEGVPLSFWTDTIAEYRLALQIFRSSNSLVVFRIPPPMEVPRVLYVFGIPTRSETNLPVGIEEFLWDLDGTEVSPPSTAVIAAQITYRRFMRYYPTYAAFKAAYATYKAALLTPPPEV